MKDMFMALVKKKFDPKFCIYGIRMNRYNGQIFVLDARFRNLVRFYLLGTFTIPDQFNNISSLIKSICTILALKERLQVFWKEIYSSSQSTQTSQLNIKSTFETPKKPGQKQSSSYSQSGSDKKGEGNKKGE